MANSDFQWAGLPVGPGSEIPITNTDVVELEPGQIVVVDPAHVLPDFGGTYSMKLPGVDGGGIALVIDRIPVGRTGRARIYGIGVSIADGAITAGLRVRGSDTKPGRAKGCQPGQAQFGYALTAGADGDPVQILIDRANNA